MALPWAGSGCARGPNVLLIVVDTLRADHLGAYGYPLETSPHLDRFAAQNLRFGFAISAAPWTSPSMASIFTAYYPTAHGVMDYVDAYHLPNDAISDDFVTLAEVFQRSGYTTWGITANAWVSAERGYAQGFDGFDTSDYATAPELNVRVFQRLAELRGSQPFFLYVHYMDPHPPHDPPRPLTQRFLEQQTRLPPERRLRGKAWRRHMAAYDAEIFVLDQALGALFAELEQLGLYDELVIAFTADHGYPFAEHGADRHGYNLHNEDTHVPLLLKHGGRMEEIDATVSTIDVYPTLLSAAGLEAPPGLQGVSLLDRLDERVARGAFSEATVGPRNNQRSLVTDGADKLILAFDKRAEDEVSEADERRVVGLFHSRQDAQERRPVADPAEVAALRERLWATYRESLEIQRGVSPAHAELDAKTAEELRRLGYLE